MHQRCTPMLREPAQAGTAEASAVILHWPLRCSGRTSGTTCCHAMWRLSENKKLYSRITQNEDRKKKKDR